MSNLYKPWFVHTESQNTRVIDSNDHIQEFLKQQMVKQDRPVGPDGFAEGIITDKTENVIPVEEPEQDMIAVNEKAEQILSQARAQADVLIDDARQEAEAIRDEAKKQGYLEGQNTLEKTAVRTGTTAEKNTVAEFLSGKTKKHGKRTGRCDIKCF